MAEPTELQRSILTGIPSQIRTAEVEAAVLLLSAAPETVVAVAAALLGAKLAGPWHGRERYRWNDGDYAEAVVTVRRSYAPSREGWEFYCSGWSDVPEDAETREYATEAEAKAAADAALVAAGWTLMGVRDA